MPIVTVRISPNIVNDESARAIRDTVEEIVESVLRVRLQQIETRVVHYGSLDKNHPAVSVEIDVGNGLDDRNLKEYDDLSRYLADRIFQCDNLGALRVNWVGNPACYVLLRVNEHSSMVQINPADRLKK